MDDAKVVVQEVDNLLHTMSVLPKVRRGIERGIYLHQLPEMLELEQPILVGTKVAAFDERGGVANVTLPSLLVENEAVHGQNVWVLGETSLNLEFHPCIAETVGVIGGVLEHALFHSGI